MEEMNNIYEAEVIEETELIPFEAEEEAGMSTGVAMAIGGLATAALIVIGKKAVEGGKKLLAKRKEKKAEAEATKEAEQPVEAPAQEEAVPENA